MPAQLHLLASKPSFMYLLQPTSSSVTPTCAIFASFLISGGATELLLLLLLLLTTTANTVLGLRSKAAAC
jgi:hypothetical protein